jgi:hypothetical protein
MHVSCFSHTWCIYNLDTTFIRCRHTCTAIHIHTALHVIALPFNPPPCSPFARFSCMITTPFYLLGNPLFGDRGANVHPHSSPVGDRLPTPCSLPSPSPPNGPHSSCYMFSKMTSHHQLHRLIHVLQRNDNEQLVFTIYNLSEPKYISKSQHDGLVHGT